MKKLKHIILLLLFISFGGFSFANNNTGLTNNQLLKSCYVYLQNTQNKQISDNTLCYGYIKGIYELMFVQKTRADIKKEKNFGFQHCGKINLETDQLNAHIAIFAYQLEQKIQKDKAYGDTSAIGPTLLSFLSKYCK